jgi:tetratricopeptide (TPR) repeat protein
MAAAYGLKRSSLEQKANDAIESKIGWSADPDVVRASEAMENSNLDEAVTILEDHLKRKPATLDALQILQQVHWRRSNIPAYLQVTAQICQRHLKAQDSENAWHAFEEYTSAGGDQLPAVSWLEICRMLETQQNFDRAASEYERLAEAHAAEKQSILALVAAGRLLLKKLNRADEALRCYEKANASKVPHLDWQPNIDAGLRDAKAALLQAVGSK